MVKNLYKRCILTCGADDVLQSKIKNVLAYFYSPESLFTSIASIDR